MFTTLINALFLICTGVLIYFSYLDIKYKELNNLPIILLFFYGVSIALLSKIALPVVCGAFLMLFTGYMLWRFDCIGGADSKLLIAIVPFMPSNSVIMILIVLFVFLVVFMIIGLLYAFILKIFKNKEKEIPFIPIILLAYVFTNLLFVS